MQSLMTTSLFDEPPKKKIEIKYPKSKDLEIDLDNDSQEDIIRKIVLNIRALRTEINEYKQYSEGTYCTQVVHDRSFDNLEKKIDELITTVEELV
jgi:effector-binding domain-containing protein